MTFLARYLTVICMMMLMAGAFVKAEEPKSPTVAMVNGYRILMSDLDREMQVIMASNPELRSRENIDVLRKRRQEALEYLIDQVIIVQQGEKLGWFYFPDAHGPAESMQRKRPVTRDVLLLRRGIKRGAARLQAAADSSPVQYGWSGGYGDRLARIDRRYP